MAVGTLDTIHWLANKIEISSGPSIGIAYNLTWLIVELLLLLANRRELWR